MVTSTFDFKQKMPPVRKIQLDKAAWAWSDNVDPEQISEENIKTAYRINLPRCKVGTCRRNCRGNPFCLSGLGEARWLGGAPDESDGDDQDLEIREPNTFVGLKNLGATCYVNSLLQLWFHNLSFRRAIFRWNPLEDPVECAILQNEDDMVNLPRTVVGHLQLLFALMQFGKRKSVDTSEFIKALDLEPSTQQDAQEFSKLFISLLEDSLSQQSEPSVRNLINDNFKGEYSYITRCSNCHKESVSPSMFYELELNVKGNKTLHESLTEFLKEEKLEGADMYSCGICQEKQEAARFIRLRSLPPVLNLQLMRFIYDRQKGHKKKLTSSIQFPDSLDMSQYLCGPSGEKMPIIYNLTAVLIHKGPSAYSGHYVAHICDQTSGTWFKFNDECVEKMEGKKLKLGSEEDIEDGGKKVKQVRLPKGVLASSNAYMLVYTAASEDEGRTPITESILTPHLYRQVQQCNVAFDAVIENAKEEKECKKVNGKVHRAEMASLLLTLPVSDSQESVRWDAISTKWLSHWLANRKPIVDPVDNAKLMCSHSKLDPNSLGDAKYINVEAAETIFEKYGGGPRLIVDESQCKECVILKCKGIRSRIKISEDAKEITNLLKQKENMDAPGFWVGKSSLKSWRRKAIALLTEKEDLRRGASNEAISNSSYITTKEESGDSASSTVLHDWPQLTSQQQSIINSHYSPSSVGLDYEDSKASGASCTNDGADTRSLHENDPDYLIVPLKKKCKLTNASPLALLNSVRDHLDNVQGKLISVFKANDTRGLSPDVVDDLRVLCTQWDALGGKMKELCERRGTLSYTSVGDACSDTTKPEDNDMEMEAAEQKVVNGRGYNNSERSKKRKLEGDYEDKYDSGDEGRTNGAGNSKSDDDDEDEKDFNEDIVCTHGNMVHEEPARRIVSENIWSILRNYFPEAREFPKETEPCHHCQSLASEDQVAKDLYRQQALLQREMLQGLWQGRNRPKQQYGTFHIVSTTDFLEPWRKFVREAGRREPLYSLRSSSLICRHGLLLYNPDLEEDSSRIAIVTDEEWAILSNLFVIEQEITVSCSPNELTTSPSVCGECVMERLENEQKALLQYNKAQLYIRQVAKTAPEDNVEAPPPSSPPPSEGSNSKRLRAETEAVRRSTRHRRTRGEKAIYMSSTQTLKDLKLQILNTCGVPPYDQHLLTEEGRELVDNEATLASLNIYPNSVIFLKVDEPPEDTVTPVEDFIRTSEPEAGFKGTGLMKRL